MVNILQINEYESIKNNENNKKIYLINCCIPLYYYDFICELGFYRNSVDYLQGLKCLFISKYK